MADESLDSKQSPHGQVDPRRRAFLRDGVSLVGGAALGTAALELLRPPASAFGAPPPERPIQDRPTCLAVARPHPKDNPPERILTCDDDKKVILWTPRDNPPGGFNRHPFVKLHGLKASYVAAAEAGDTVLTASFDGIVIVRDLNDRNDNKALQFDRHLNPGFAPPGRSAQVWVATLSRDGTKALSGDNFGNILYWDTRNPDGVNPHPFINWFRDANEWVGALVFMPPVNDEQKRFLSGHENGQMILWDFTKLSRDPNNVIPDPHPDVVKRRFRHPNPNIPVNAVAATRKGNVLISAGFDGRVRIWNENNNAAYRHELQLDQFVWRIAISPDDQTLAVAIQDENNRQVGRVLLFDISNSNPGVPPMPVPGPPAEIGGVMGVGFLDHQHVVYTTGVNAGGPADQLKVFRF